MKKITKLLQIVPEILPHIVRTYDKNLYDGDGNLLGGGQGYQGTQGPQGPQGISESGSQGPQGPQGSQGPGGSGSAPIYPSTEIPFGDGSTPGGGTSPNITWDDDNKILNVGDIINSANGTKFTVDDSGKNVSIIADNFFKVVDVAGHPYFVAQSSSTQIGDQDNESGGQILTIDQGARQLEFQGNTGNGTAYALISSPSSGATGIAYGGNCTSPFISQFVVRIIGAAADEFFIGTGSGLTQGDTVTGSVSGAIGTVQTFGQDNTGQYLVVTPVSGAFVGTDILTNGTGGTFTIFGGVPLAQDSFIIDAGSSVGSDRYSLLLNSAGVTTYYGTNFYFPDGAGANNLYGSIQGIKVGA